MPQRIAQALGETSPADYAGMTPEQVAQFGQQRQAQVTDAMNLMMQMDQQQLQREQFEFKQQEAALDRALQDRQFKLQKEAHAAEMEAHERDELEHKHRAQQLRLKADVTQRLSDRQIQTAMGPMSALKAQMLGKAGINVGAGPGEPPEIFQINVDGREKVFGIDPTTGERMFTEDLGEATEDHTVWARTDLSEYKSLPPGQAPEGTDWIMANKIGQETDQAQRVRDREWGRMATSEWYDDVIEQFDRRTRMALRNAAPDDEARPPAETQFLNAVIRNIKSTSPIQDVRVEQRQGEYVFVDGETGNALPVPFPDHMIQSIDPTRFFEDGADEPEDDDPLGIR